MDNERKIFGSLSKIASLGFIKPFARLQSTVYTGSRNRSYSKVPPNDKSSVRKLNVFGAV